MRFIVYALSALIAVVAAADVVDISERSADPAPAAAAAADDVYASRQLTRSRLIQNLKDREAHEQMARAGTALEARASGRSYPACYPTDSEGVKFAKGFARYTGWDIPEYDHIDVSPRPLSPETR